MQGMEILDWANTMHCDSVHCDWLMTAAGLAVSHGQGSEARQLVRLFRDAGRQNFMVRFGG